MEPTAASTQPTADVETETVPDYAIKVSVSMPGSLVQGVRDRVGRREFSRYVTQAVERQIALDKLGELVDDYVAEHGPFSEEITREVEKEWREAMGA